MKSFGGPPSALTTEYHCQEPETSTSGIHPLDSPVIPREVAVLRFNDAMRVDSLSRPPSKPQPIFTKNDWNSRFQGWSEQDILSQYHLYKYESFREYIQELSEFEDFIYEFYELICHKLRKNIISRVKFELGTLGDF